MPEEAWSPIAPPEGAGGVATAWWRYLPTVLEACRARAKCVPSSAAFHRAALVLLTLNPHQRQLTSHAPLRRALGFSAPLRQEPRIIQGSNLRQEHASALSALLCRVQGRSSAAWHGSGRRRWRSGTG
jgi:hypothetical protein